MQKARTHLPPCVTSSKRRITVSSSDWIAGRFSSSTIISSLTGARRSSMRPRAIVSSSVSGCARTAALRSKFKSRYAMNIFRAAAVRSLEEATRAIPVIDFGPAFRANDRAVDDVATAVRDACERVGFFYMAGHGVPQATIDAAFEAAREFHALPLADKMQLRINEN